MKIISFVTRKGGSGKSTLAINIAVAAEASNERVLLLDCDGQRTVSKWAERRVAETPVFEITEETHQLHSALRLAQSAKFTLVVIDTPGFNVPIVHDVVKLSDFCLVPTRPSTADIEAMATVLHTIRSNKKDFSFILNQAPMGARTAEAAVGLEALGTVCPVSIGMRVSFQDALETGKGITEFQPRGKAAIETRALWGWVRERMAT